MASFRNGIKILGEFSIKQGLGRIRSFSEDRKPGRWLPEDQWAVRQPGTTCPDPCKPKKPQKPSKSWLSLCKDPEPPITCDIRHSNCPLPPPPKEGPWYSLDNLMPKKKSAEKPPPLYSCREEKKRREAEGYDEVCEKKKQKPKIREPDNQDICCMPKPDPCPAPVITMSCPLPKELDIMLWCGRPSTDRSRIAARCQSDRLPYEEFRPRKCWKPLPFSLPCKSEPFCPPSFNRGSIAYAEFKQVEVPKPLYTRYKSVELCNEDFMLCMAEVKCPDDKESNCLPSTSSVSSYSPTTPPCPSTPCPPPRRSATPCCRIPPQSKPNKKKVSIERRVIEAASGKPVKIRKAVKYTFKPKPTKLIEKRVLKNPFAGCKSSNPESRPENEEDDDCDEKCRRRDEEPPKVLTGTLTKEPQVYERDFCCNNPPGWMYVLCKPGCKETPLIPKCDRVPDEPDWKSETDGLNFYDDKNENINPKPPTDPCKCVKVEPKPVVCEQQIEKEKPAVKVKSRLVLMPECYNIKYSRSENPCAVNNECESTSFDEFIQAKTSSSKKCSKSYPQMKENILYDLQRLCPSAPIDPTKMGLPCRKPVEDPCAPRFFRCYSTFTSSRPRNLTWIQQQRVLARTECGDSSGKCKPRKIGPKKVQCPEEKPKPSCAQMALPCCRKAAIPPSCSVRKPLPLCKKKLPPKPSFSECAKDPPPCPKMTECNAWEKRMREDSKRKYSDWAVLRNEFDLRQVNEEKIPQKFEKAGLVKSLESQAREVYANTVKCRTIKPKHNVLGTPKDRLVLGLNDDPSCDYEQRSVMVKQKEKSNRLASKDELLSLKGVASKDEQKENADVQPVVSTMPETNSKNEKILEAEETNDGFVTPSYNAEEDKEISRDLMGSIGSWINEFFSVPAKRPVTVPQSVISNQHPGPEKIDDEYLKSLNDFKEQMKKKLKTETTVHLSTGEKSFQLNFDKSTDKKGKKKSNLENSECVDGSRKKTKLISHNRNPPVHRFPVKINEKENIYVTLRREDGTNVKDPILIKEKLLRKERSKNSKLEEYFFSTPPELSKSLLLNINDQEKCSQLYKNARMQEPQPYHLRRTSSYQRNARCYTTNANFVENSKANSLISGNKKHKRPVFFANDATTTDECLSPKKKITSKKKLFSDIPGDDLSFDKIGSTKCFSISFSESNKYNEMKASSEELVRHLIKKTKVTSRPQSFKKKSKSLVVETNHRSRFLQSATTSLVVNVLAKKENNLTLLKAGSRLTPENKILKPDRESKEWSTKHRDLRFEIKKAVSPTFNKSSYLSDVSDKPENMPFKRLNENLFSLSGKDVKEKSLKSRKGEDIRCILSKIDGRYDTLRAQQKLKKNVEENEVSESQNARFQKQHELFKKAPKIPQETESSEATEGVECKIEEKSESCITTANPSEVVVLTTEIQPVSNKPEKYELTVVEKTPSPSLTDNSKEEELLDRICTNEGPHSLDIEKAEMTNYKNKLVKTKSLQYLKEEDMRTLLSPGTELPSEDKKQISKVYERQMSPVEIRPQKTLEPVVLNRPYSTTMMARNQKSTKLIPFGQPKSVLPFSDGKKDFERKNLKEKKNEKTEKSVDSKDNDNCGFQPPKKPGPNCDKSDLKP